MDSERGRRAAGGKTRLWKRGDGRLSRWVGPARESRTAGLQECLTCLVLRPFVLNSLGAQKGGTVSHLFCTRKGALGWQTDGRRLAVRGNAPASRSGPAQKLTEGELAKCTNLFSLGARFVPCVRGRGATRRESARIQNPGRRHQDVLLAFRRRVLRRTRSDATAAKRGRLWNHGTSTQWNVANGG